MIATVDVTQAADCRAVLGAPGTGKSHYTKAEIRKAKRVLVWDIEDEYDLPAVPLVRLPAFLHKTGKKPFKVKVVGSGDKARRDAEFNIFCKLAFTVGALLVVVEELRFVTQPSRAPEGWALLTLRGRKRGIRIIGTSQRPASIDKDFLGNCTMIRTGALSYPEDRKTVAAVIGCPVDIVMALTGYRAICWHRDTRKISHG